jgi:hypothetical protein
MIRLSIDRFEGDKKRIAVLLTDDGTQIDFPKVLLPKGAKAGDLLALIHCSSPPTWTASGRPWARSEL